MGPWEPVPVQNLDLPSQQAILGVVPVVLVPSPVWTHSGCLCGVQVTSGGMWDPGWRDRLEWGVALLLCGVPAISWLPCTCSHTW